MNLVNNQAGHEPTVCQQFEHVTCAMPGGSNFNSSLELKTVLVIYY